MLKDVGLSMALILPNTPDDIYYKMQAKATSLGIQTKPPHSQDPGPLEVLMAAIAGGVFELFQVLAFLERQLFPTTASGDYLARLGARYGVVRIPATPSKGKVIFVSDASTVIPVNTPATVDGQTYLTDIDTAVGPYALAIGSAVKLGNTAIANVTTTDKLATGLEVNISGFSSQEYNGVVTITVTGPGSFEYPIDSAAPSAASGTGSLSYTGGDVAVTAEESGASTNKDSGTVLTLNTSLAGVEQQAIVNFNGLKGGADLESSESYKENVLFAWQNRIVAFNIAGITAAAKTVAGVTRVFVYPTTPGAGYVTIYFLRENDVTPIPDAGEIAQVKAAVSAIKEAHTTDDQIIVLAPSVNTLNISISGLSPDTPEMRMAIINSLKELFKTTEPGKPMYRNKIITAIQNTIDTSYQQVSNFNLLSPLGDTTVANDTIILLGSVAFS
jgi:uncharacterized phage protein gp47/JayE